MDRRERKWQQKQDRRKMWRPQSQPEPQPQQPQPVATSITIDLAVGSGDAPDGFMHAFYSSKRTAFRGASFHRWTGTMEPPTPMPRHCRMAILIEDVGIGASECHYLGLIRSDNWTREEGVSDKEGIAILDCAAWTTKSGRFLFPMSSG
ncbi:hypothetical protein QKT49_gp173 [Acanthamoeba castellanii medusavirus]|uniref:Uncharacterized protein n=1 Tax=Acanthamoeba castellanii medusavirus J1 TaxID=3114988 RepID=A0A3T1CXN2_9VIRU|nr:hypothetical protein QKT49_gp173 [Acanthamoeba castellanii medusavirus]BBI30590.1 hypothetical protein [Acanthamoeba castellanii medusavirus J1]